MNAARACLIVLVADRAAIVSAIFCQSTLYTESYVCEDGSNVGANGCCASTDRCPTSCMSSAWSSSNGVSTCTCTDCNYGFKLSSLTQSDRYLKAHNYFRCRHGQNALIWDSTVAASAEAWAGTCPSQGSNPAHLRQDGTSAYDLSPPCGENVAAGQQSPEAAVEAWYSEITDPGYTPGTANQPPTGTGHYTALIWAATTKLGCAQEACASGTPSPVHVCHYSDAPPNFGFDADYFANVPQSNDETTPEASCCTSVYGSDDGVGDTNDTATTKGASDGAGDPADTITTTATTATTGSPGNSDAACGTGTAAPLLMLWLCMGAFARS